MKLRNGKAGVSQGKKEPGNKEPKQELSALLKKTNNTLSQTLQHTRKLVTTWHKINKGPSLKYTGPLCIDKQSGLR